MGCSGCSVDMNGVPKGCKSNGHCSSGRCNKMNTHDWLSNLELHDPLEFQMAEISFKNGARKDFFKTNKYVDAITGDLVVVESNGGYDIGQITLSGELVRLQMRKKSYDQDRVFNSVIRIANDRDIEKLDEARSREHATMVRARAIARMLDLDMKIGDVEFQGDNRKATFYYTADGRVDFRELVRMYAGEFKVKVEMRQIGSRQESARIGGLGPCGRELCCSTWLSDFKSVTTSAARYQNLAINQTKLSGQCGRLKCCLNYELDTYIDALKSFPKNAEYIYTSQNKYELVKTDIFKGIMFYLQIMELGRGPIIAISKERVSEIVQMNKKGKKPDDIGALDQNATGTEEKDLGYEDVTGAIELPITRNPKKNKYQNKKRSDSNRNHRSDRDDFNKKNKTNHPEQNRGESKANRDHPNKSTKRKPKKRFLKNRKPKPPENTN